MDNTQDYNTLCPICGRDCRTRDHCKHFAGWTYNCTMVDEPIDGREPYPMTSDMQVVKTGLSLRVFQS